VAARRFAAISLYSGIGGLDFGFEAAGFDTRVAVEMDDACCAAMRLNRPEWGVIEDDIHQVSSRQILATAGLKAGEADVLIGGPPCQPFSKSSYWVTGDSLRLDDPRAGTLAAYLRVLKETRPRTFLLENVGGLAFRDKDEGLRLLLKGIAQLGYTVNWKTLVATDYGVPQQRERVFLIGSRGGVPFEFPQATHADREDIGPFDDLLPYSTAWDAIGGLPEPDDVESLAVGGKWGALLPTIPEGYNYLWHTNRGGGSKLFGWRTRYWCFLLKLAKGQPSWTIQAQPGSAIGPFHWKNRRLSARELCRLQTFPDGLRFNCGRTDLQRMLGNAVPSLLAEVLAREIRRQLLAAPVRGPLKLLPAVKTPVPPAERHSKRLPAQYVPLIGEHKDHPGEGKGASARKRPSRNPELPVTAEG
jgi:DNA (cytosine-5)-methyltransferase 1